MKLEVIEERVSDAKEDNEQDSDEEVDGKETQEIARKALQAREQVENFLQSFSGDSENLDKSLDEDRDKQIQQLKGMVMDKDKLQFIKRSSNFSLYLQ